jgi:hypothetical protein
MKKGRPVMQMIATAGVCAAVYAAVTFAVLRLAGLSTLALAMGCMNGLALMMALGAGFLVGVRGLVVPVQEDRLPTQRRRKSKSGQAARQGEERVVYMLLEDNEEADARLFDGWLK